MFQLKVLLVLLIAVHTITGRTIDIKTIDVNTSSGIVRGEVVELDQNSIDQFLGIPFAQPPVGGLRFSKPKPIETPLPKVIDATKAKYSCMQKDGTGMLNLNEDCLTLDVWAPHRQANDSSRAATGNDVLKPVMFWIYGGSLTSGSIYLPTYDGRALVTHDVVVVSTNYRLGAFGFLYGGQDEAPGDVGFFDQLLALKWTRENIHLFGGDANQITIFGESAGSWSVSAHVLSPQSRGLFKRAILESGSVLQNKKDDVLTKDNALKEAKEMAKAFQCTDEKQWLDCMRKVDAKDINNYKNLDIYPIFGTQFLPLNAQTSFKTHNYSSDIDIMAGVMKNEGSILAQHMYPLSDKLKTKAEFLELVKSVAIPDLDAQKIVDFYLDQLPANQTNVTKHAFWEFFGDLGITCPTYLFAKQFAQMSPTKEAYFYQWTYPSHFLAPIIGCKPEMGICHATEIEYVFGLSVLMHMSPKDEEFSQSVMKMWTNFAKNGKPMDGTTYKWPRLLDPKVGIPTPRMKEIHMDRPDTILSNLFAKTCDGFWKDYYL